MADTDELETLWRNAQENESARVETLTRCGVNGPGAVSFTPQQISDLQMNLLLNQARSANLQSIILVRIAQSLARIETQLTKPYPQTGGDRIPPEVAAGFDRI